MKRGDEQTLGDYFTLRKERGESSLPILSVTMNDGLVSRDTLGRRMESALRAEEHLRIRKGDIAYNTMRMWQGAFGLADSDGIVSPAYVVLKPKPGIDPRFAAHWFKSSRMIHLFWAYSYGLTEDRLRLYGEDFRMIPVTPPALKSQRRAAEILDKWDRWIEIFEAGIAALRRRHAELVRRLLQMGSNRSASLGDLAEINPAPDDIEPETFVSFVTMSDVSNYGRLLFHRRMKRSEIGSGFTTFSNHDVLVAKITPCFENGKGAHVERLYGGYGFGSTEFHVIRPHDWRDARFIHHHVSAVAFRRNGERYMTGTAGQKRVPAEYIQDYRIPVMSLEQRLHASALLDSTEKAIHHLSLERDLHVRRKEYLMQRLLRFDEDRVADSANAVLVA